MKSKWKRIAAVAAALILCFALLDVFCFWYYNPAAYVWDDARATDTVRAPGVFTSRAKEGIAWARVDADGYNNPGVPGEDGVFVLMMGSSHTEGFNVMQHETTSSLLQENLLAAGVEGNVYNLGMSAHVFARNAGNMDRALERYSPRYIVLETQTVKIGRSEIERAAGDGFERLPWTRPVISEWVSERPLLRTVYRQWETLTGGEGEEAVEAEITPEQLEQYGAALTQLLIIMRETADVHGATLIIYYHPHLQLNADGSVSPLTDADCLRVFSESCAAAGVTFVDMTQPFMQAYADQHILPHGFINSAPGTGHLNADGNRIIADVLCDEICRQEVRK